MIYEKVNYLSLIGKRINKYDNNYQIKQFIKNNNDNSPGIKIIIKI